MFNGKECQSKLSIEEIYKKHIFFLQAQMLESSAWVSRRKLCEMIRSKTKLILSKRINLMIKTLEAASQSVFEIFVKSTESIKGL